jgi:muconate cycloisomerase
VPEPEGGSVTASGVIATVNPATGETVKEFSPHGAAEVEASIAAAYSAYEALRGTTFAERAAWMRRAQHFRGGRLVAPGARLPRRSRGIAPGAAGRERGQRMSVRVRNVDAVIVDLPVRRPHGFSTAAMSGQSVVIVRIADSDGLQGIGEGVTPGPWWSGESVESIKLMIDGCLAPAVCELPDASPHTAMRAMDRRVAHNRFAKAAVEVALWDLLGKRYGLCVAELLGGRAHQNLPITWALSAEDRPSVVEEAEARAAEGYRGFKFKMGAQAAAADVARVAAIRSKLPADVSTVADPNGAWDEHTAAVSIDGLAASGIDIVEQPVAGWNRAAMKRLRHRCGTRLMADEGAQTPHDMIGIVTHEAADSVSLKLPKAGGLSQAVAMASIGVAGGIDLYGGSTLESSVGAAASAQVYSTWRDLIGCELVGPLLLREDIVTTPLRYEGGKLTVPTGPGLGVQLDDDAVAFHVRR